MKTEIAQRMEGFSPFYVMELLQRTKQLEAKGRDIIHMEIGESDFATPKNIVNAGLKYIQTAEIKYTAAAGLPALREKISAYYQQTYAVDVDPKRIFITPGASGAFLLALGVTLNPSEEILMADPCYPCNNNFVQLYGGKSKVINVDAGIDYQLSAELIKQNWTGNSRGVVVASPSNPTGTVISETEMAKPVQQMDELGGCFFSDEIYHGLVYGKKVKSALVFSDNVFVINSFSKYFSMTGWRIGWLVVPEGFINAVERLAQTIFISTATHSQYAALAAFSEQNLMELENRKKEFENRRDYLYQHLLRLGFKIAVKPEGAFYIYANCSKFTKDSFQFSKDLLEQQGGGSNTRKRFW